MLDFPNAKINIGLNIIRRRSDGYHDLETLYYPIGLCDILEFIPCTSSMKIPDPALTNTGIQISDSVEKNLCIKAYKLIMERFSLPPVHIHLHKVIPPGSGLGGGSSNGAFMIRMLTQEFNLGLTDAEMERMAGELGSDCPFFIRNLPAFASGRGENLTPVTPVLLGYYLVVIHPGIHINTGEAYARIKLDKPCVSLIESIKYPVSEWKDIIRNDFENLIFRDYPEIEEIKNLLYREGAIYSSLSGSGSSVYGIFEKEIRLSEVPGRYFIWQGKI